METKYSFRMKSDARGVVKIKTTHPHGYSYVRPYLLSTSKERLPEDVSFRVVKGNRWTDIVVYYESEGRNFYSQRFIDLLNRFVDMSRFSYPIKIENTDLTYYAIYNLPECTFLNRKASFLKPGTTPCFDLHENMPNLFSLEGTNLRVCSHEVKDAIEKAKLTNVYISEVFGLTNEESNALGF